MSFWGRVGLLGSMFYCLHRKRMVYADQRGGDHGIRRDDSDYRREEGISRRDYGDHVRNVHEHRRVGDHRKNDEDHNRPSGDQGGDDSVHKKNGSYYRRNGEGHRSDCGGAHRRDASEYRTQCNEPGQDSATYGRTDTPSSRDLQELELKLVQIMYRHGARTPLKPIPQKEQVEWPLSILDVPDHTLFDYTITSLSGGLQPASKHEQNYRSTILKGGSYAGQLTTVGMLQMFALGERLRETYVDKLQFLSPVFTPSEIFVRSTNMVRNMESTRCLLAGLFQQQQEEPVTIVTAEEGDEILLPNYDSCQGLKQLANNRLLNASSQHGMSEELKKLQREIGIDDEDDVNFILIFDNLQAQQAHGLAGTLVLKNLVQITEQRAVDIIFYIMDQNRELIQMSVGAFLHVVQENMLEVVKSSAPSQKSRKLFLYAVHDITLLPILMALGIFDKKWPPYASDLTLELYQHRRSHEWSARLCYNGREQVVKGCRAGLCPLEDFLKAISGYVVTPEEYKALCAKTAKVQEEKSKY